MCSHGPAPAPSEHYTRSAQGGKGDPQLSGAEGGVSLQMQEKTLAKCRTSLLLFKL